MGREYTEKKDREKRRSKERYKARGGGGEKGNGRRDR